MMNTATSGIWNLKSRIWNLKSIIFVACVLLAGTAHAQQRPLVTEDPETIGAGRVLLEGGFSLDSEQSNFVNGLKGDIARLATFGASIGIGAAAEVQIDGGLLSAPHRDRAASTRSARNDHAPSPGRQRIEHGGPDRRHENSARI